MSGARWIKSSYSQTQNDCVELARFEGRIGVRDSKKGDASPVLEFSVTQFATLVTETKAGEFDNLTPPPPPPPRPPPPAPPPARAALYRRQ